jgi:hypothetical protein
MLADSSNVDINHLRVDDPWEHYFCTIATIRIYKIYPRGALSNNDRNLGRQSLQGLDAFLSGGASVEIEITEAFRWEGQLASTGLIDVP